jgi:hypothetical protein
MDVARTTDELTMGMATRLMRDLGTAESAARKESSRRGKVISKLEDEITDFAHSVVSSSLDAPCGVLKIVSTWPIRQCYLAPNYKVLSICEGVPTLTRLGIRFLRFNLVNLLRFLRFVIMVQLPSPLAT